MLSEGQGRNLKSGLRTGFTPILLGLKGETRVLKCSAPEDGQAGLGHLRVPHSAAERTRCRLLPLGLPVPADAVPAPAPRGR